MKLLGKIVALVLGTIVLLVLVLQFVINMPFVSRKVKEAACEALGCGLSFSRLNVSLIRDFPEVRMTVDSLSVVYPHDRFAAYDTKVRRSPVLNCGRGPLADTLLRFDKFTAAVNPWRLFHGQARLDDASVRGLAVYAHRYDTAGNWNIFRSSEAAAGKKDGPVRELPCLSVRQFRIAPDARFIYTDDFNRTYVSCGMQELLLEADLRITDGGSKIVYDNVLFSVDSLRLSALMRRDEYDVSFSNFSVTNPDRDVLDLTLSAEAGARMRQYGEIQAPVSLDARFGLRFSPSGTQLEVIRFKSRVAYASVDAEGYLRMLKDSSDVRMNAAAAVLAEVPGAVMCLKGKSDDMLGKDPFFEVRADCNAIIDSLLRYVPESAGMDAEGDLNLRLDAAAHMSELDTYKFRDAAIKGQIESDRLRLEIPSDSVRLMAHNTRIDLSSNSDGLDVSACFDSLFFNRGDSLRARARGMKNTFRVYKVEDRGEMTPRIALNTDSRTLFVKAGENRIGMKSLDIGAAIQKRVRHRKSVRRARTGEQGFSDGDVAINLDSTLTAFVRQWKPYGNISASSGFFSSPSIPLRTRLRALNGKFTANEMNIDTLDVRMGTSDLVAKGSISDIRRAIRGRGPIKADMSIVSRRLNLNELLVALQNGKNVTDCHPDAESEGSFVVDSIETANVKKDIVSLIVVPGNVDAKLALKAERVDYSDILVSPFSADLRMKDRTLQLVDANAVTNLGGVHMDAFYSTRSRSDVSAGLGLKLSGVSAQGIIHLIPSVDNMMPALKSFEGKLGVELSATTKIDTAMNLIVPSLDGILRISGEDLMVRDAGDLKRITRMLLFRNKNIGRIQNMSVDAVVHNGKLDVFPFELDVDRYKLALRGTQGFDGKMNYHVSVMRSPFLIPFGINIYGYTNNWRFSLGFAKYREGKVPAYTEKLDNMQFNIVKSIKDIYRKGVGNAREQARRSSELLASSPVMSDSLDAVVLQQLDEVAFDMAAAASEEELDVEVEAALEQNIIDMDTLIREYESATEDRIIERRIRRLRRKDR